MSNIVVALFVTVAFTANAAKISRDKSDADFLLHRSILMKNNNATPPPNSKKEKRVVSQEITAAIGEMAQYDIQAFIINVPAEATAAHPTVDNITYPIEAIEYGLWFNETQVQQLINANSIGSLFNSPVSGGAKTPPDANWWRALQTRLYDMSYMSSPILFGLDNVHGVNYAFGATLFPQAIGTASTFDRGVAFDLGNITGRESRYLGIPWSFAPILGIAVQPSWPRVYETFGEDPMLAGEMGKFDITGMQLPPPNDMFPDLCFNGSISCPTNAVAACMKHFVGYSNTRTGRDRTPAWIPDNILMQYFVPSFKAAIDAGVLSAMENYIQVNGQPVVSSKLYLNFLLRTVLQWTGMLTTDYNEIYMLRDFHNATGSYEESVELAINQTTIDMGMFATPYWSSTFTDNLAELWKKEKISTERLLTSASRVQTLKSLLGLQSGSPVPPKQTAPIDSYKHSTATAPGETCFFGCPEHHAAALNAARKSMILLQNDGILPLKPNATKKVAVIGKGCGSVPVLAGGWTIHWQGSENPADFPYGHTVADGLGRAFSVTYAEGCDITEKSICNATALSQAVDAARQAELVVVCVGEAPYAEVVGDIDDLTLPGQQIYMVEQIAAVNRNIVTVLVEGRPRVLKTIPQLSRAVLMAWLPGPFGGQAITETLTGVNNPGGRLPISYPKHLSKGPVQYWRAYSANEFNDYDLQWTFGTGLSYTTFQYTNVDVAWKPGSGRHFFVAVNVTNVGNVAGDEVVLAFSTQAPRPIPAEVKRLRNFTRITLAPGESRRVELLMNIMDLVFYDSVTCEYLALHPTYITVGSADPFVEPDMTKRLDLSFFGDGIAFVGCPWGEWYVSQSRTTSFISTKTTVAPAPEDDKDYFMSSVVCFVGGVIATCFLVFFVRKRNRYLRTDHVQLFEPSGV